MMRGNRKWILLALVALVAWWWVTRPGMMGGNGRGSVYDQRAQPLGYGAPQ